MHQLFLKGGPVMKLYKEDIKAILLHRDPFLLLDHVEIVSENHAVGSMFLKESGFYFQGHFDHKPIMPGVIMVEACAQTGAVLLLSKPKYKDQMSYFAGIDKVRFKKWVYPNDTLITKVTLHHVKTTIGKATIEAFVDDNLVLTGEILFTIQPK